MSDGVLSQEEIDALLHAGANDAPQEELSKESTEQISNEYTPQKVEAIFSGDEIDAIGEVANIVMGTAATALSSLLGQKIDITTPQITITSTQNIKKEHPLPYLLVDVEYSKGIEGSNMLIIKDTDAQIIVDLMMGGDGSSPPKELSEMHLSAISEAMNQMMGSAATSMSSVLHRRIEITPPQVEVIDLATDDFKENIGNNDQEIVCISFSINVEGLIDSTMMQLLPIKFAREMANELLNSLANEDVTATLTEQVAATETPVVNFDFDKGVEQNMAQKRQKPTENVSVQPAQFSNLNTGMSSKVPSNIDLIMDVPLQITVELGRTRKTIREILALGPGSVVELDKLAGEPVDLMVNGKLLAKGEVVVIDENFGIRVTDIVSPLERVTNLQ